MTLFETADAAIRHAAEDAVRFALDLLVERSDVQALKALHALTETHPERASLRLAITALARRMATRRVLDRLPSDLGDLVAEFHAACGAAR